MNELERTKKKLEGLEGAARQLLKVCDKVDYQPFWRRADMVGLHEGLVVAMGRMREELIVLHDPGPLAERVALLNLCGKLAAGNGAGAKGEIV